MKRKLIRSKGKIQLSQYFKNLKIGDSVAVVKVPGLRSSFPDRIQGRTGTIEEKRGKSYIVRLMDFNQEKRFIIQAIHLKKLGEKTKQIK